MAGSHLPTAVSYCLHCKKAANSAPHKLMCTSHNDPCNIQIMSTTAIKNVMVKDGFCDISALLLYGEALTFQLLKLEDQSLGLNIKS